MDGMQQVLAGAAAIAIAGIATGACADVAISTKPTQNMTCSGGVCTPTAKKAVLNVGDLANMLAGGDVKISSGSMAQDIEIDAALSWTGTHRLTLDAYHSIAFNKPVVVAGTGALTITTNDGGFGGDFRFFGKGHVEFWDLSSSLIVNGQRYILVKSLKQLDTEIRRGVDGSYALAKKINASNRTYDQSPINRPFAGTFEGLGNTISNLTISGDGLFFEYDTEGDPNYAIRDIGLTSVNINGGASHSIGALVGYVLYGMIKNSYATGQISGSGSSLIGGLVGGSNTSTISNSYAAVAVLGSGVSIKAGGLVGYLEGDCLDGCEGIIDRSYATGPVTGGDSASAGGLVGYNYGGSVTNSYATGTVSSGNSAFVGGLIGSNTDNSNPSTNPKLTETYSTGAVSGGSGATVGGLIGQDAADSKITNSYWDLDTSGISDPAHGAGNIANDPGITGLTTQQFTSGLPAGFSPPIWKEKASINGGYPYLIDLPPG
jgi:hypothetical protein